MNVLVIGNGFDLDLGLKTKYSDFADSEQWKKMYQECAEKSDHYSLMKYLNDKKKVESWFDIEALMLSYVSTETSKLYVHDINIDRNEYMAISKALKDYINNELQKSNIGLIQPKTPEKESIRILTRYMNSPKSKIYTFNFTSLVSICKRIGIDNTIAQYNYVHGNIEDDTQILGIDIKDMSQIISDYSFMIKSNNRHYRSTDIESDLRIAEEVVVFGHSLNMIDSIYFDDYLKEMEKSSRKKRLTIITKDEDSKRTILDNIRMMGISIPRLYAHSDFDVLFTSPSKDKKRENEERFNKLINRL